MKLIASRGCLKGYPCRVAASLCLCMYNAMLLSCLVTSSTPSPATPCTCITADASNELVSAPLDALAWHHVVGACLFLWGSYHQNKCHRILADLRKRPKQKGTSLNSGNYSVPYGDWFTYVSNPHYLAEVLLYVGVSCIVFSRLWTDWALPSFSLFILTFSGKMTHSWYLETFDSYKKLGRKVIIPYIY